MSEVKHFIIDLETLGTRAGCVVLTIAVNWFYLEETDDFPSLVNRGKHIKVEVDEQVSKGLKIDKFTLDWWSRQPIEAKKILKPSLEDVSPVDGLVDLRQFLESSSYSYKSSWVWSRGINFDLPILEALCVAFDVKFPLNGMNARDTRTMIDVLTGSTNGAYNIQHPEEFVKHNALHDVCLDIMRMQEIYRILLEDD